jgi:hypothetical protein
MAEGVEDAGRSESPSSTMSCPRPLSAAVSASDWNSDLSTSDVRKIISDIMSWLLSGFRVVIGGSCDQGSDEGAEQSLSALPGVVDELEEAEIGG